MIRIIIIDDEILARIGIQTFLENKQNIAVQGTFSSSLDALVYLREQGPVDIVITDIEMPDMDGLILIKAVREENLSTGIIIVSCHDNFSYAREALELGADSYILKQEVTEEKLYSIIEKINAEKIIPRLAEKSGEVKTKWANEKGTQCFSYAVGVLSIHSAESMEASLLSGNVDRTMLIHLLENIVEKEGMGTFFSPYNKEMFILFQFPKQMEEAEKMELLRKNCSDLRQNVRLFINERLMIGCSRFFEELKEIRAYYQEGLELLSLDFYERESCFFMADRQQTERKISLALNVDSFLEPGWLEEFSRELNLFFDFYGSRRTDVESVKSDLFHQINQFIYALAQKYSLAGQMILEFAVRMEGIMNAAGRSLLEHRLKADMAELSEELLKRLADDTMETVLQYIEAHICEQVPLTEAAAQSFMSVPHFCKKFKEYTGETYVKYINNRRVEKIKEYLDCGSCSLNEIAAEMNFQNMNYMIRLFKNVTGMTIREYKRTVIRNNKKPSK